MSELGDLYQDLILHHSKSPRNRGVLEDANHSADGHNPLCGDRIHLTLKVEDGRVADVRFEGEGCAISTAASSVMTDAIKGMAVEEVQALFDAFHALVTGEGTEVPPDQPKLAAFAGVRRFPVRVKCAMLPWRTLESALADEQETVTTE